MDITISLDPLQVEQLRAEATARGQSPEQAASVLVTDGLARRASEERWLPRNDRRCALIEKGRHAALNADEQAELVRLQSELDGRLEAIDLGRIARVEEVLARMRGLRHGAES